MQHCGCTNDAPTPTSASKTTSLDKGTGASFLNNISVTAKGGLQLSRAYLTDKNGSLLPLPNTVEVGDTVYLHLQFSEGWIAQQGRISVGAEQVIKTAKGEAVIRSGDLLAGLPSLPEKEGARLLLPAVILRSRDGIDYFVVQFRVWDKKGPGEVKGTYRLFLTPKDGS